jgi:O-antigen biosynthesis protein WbqP
MKRAFDAVLAFVLGLLCALPLMLLAIGIKITSRGPVIYWSTRVGRNNQLFRMPKLRSLQIDTPQVATHLLENPERFYTPLGRFLRRSSLDELPQLWSVLLGDMSFVGPRPALFNQTDLIELRTRHGVQRLRPGITGLAQINGRDDLTIVEKVAFDAQYLQKQTNFYDLYILCLTVLAVVKKKNVAH